MQIIFLAFMDEKGSGFCGRARRKTFGYEFKWSAGKNKPPFFMA